MTRVVLTFTEESREALDKLKDKLIVNDKFTLDNLLPPPQELVEFSKKNLNMVGEKLLIPLININAFGYDEIMNELEDNKSRHVLELLESRQVTEHPIELMLLELYIRYTKNVNPTYGELVEWIDRTDSLLENDQNWFLFTAKKSLADTREAFELIREYGHYNLGIWTYKNYGYLGRTKLVKSEYVSDTELNITVDFHEVDFRILANALQKLSPNKRVTYQHVPFESTEDKRLFEYEVDDKEIKNLPCKFGNIHKISNLSFVIKNDDVMLGYLGRFIIFAYRTSDEDMVELTFRLVYDYNVQRLIIDSHVITVQLNGNSIIEAIKYYIDSEEDFLIAHFGKYLTFRRCFPGVVEEYLSKEKSNGNIES